MTRNMTKAKVNVLTKVRCAKPPEQWGTGVKYHRAGKHWDWQFYNSAYGMAIGSSKTKAEAVAALKLAAGDLMLGSGF